MRATAQARHWWPVAAIGAAAGLAAILAEPRFAAALALLLAAAAAVTYLLERPSAWIPAFLATSLLLPPLPFSAGGVELPLHPAIFVFAAAAVAGWARLYEWRVERNALSAACVAVVAALLLSLPWAFFYSGGAVGAQSVVRWLLLCQGFVVLAWVAWGPLPEQWDGRGLVRLVLWAALLSSAFAIVDFVYQFPATVRFSPQYLYVPEGVYRRAQGIFYDANALGNFCAMMLALILALGGAARRALHIRRPLAWLPAPFLAAALVLSFSRSSVLNLLVAGGLLAWLRRRALVRRRAVAAAAALAAVCILSIALLAPAFGVRFGQRLQFTVSEFFSRPNEVLSTRLDSWRFLLGFLADHPLHLLFGIGYKSLPYTGYFAHTVVADNMYLSVLVEAGIPGLAALLFFCGVVLAYSWRLARHEDAVVAALGSFLFAFWCGEMLQMLSVDALTYWRVTPVYFALLGLAIRRSRQAVPA